MAPTAPTATCCRRPMPVGRTISPIWKMKSVAVPTRENSQTLSLPTGKTSKPSDSATSQKNSTRPGTAQPIWTSAMPCASTYIRKKAGRWHSANSTTPTTKTAAYLDSTTAIQAPYACSTISRTQPQPAMATRPALCSRHRVRPAPPAIRSTTAWSTPYPSVTTTTTLLPLMPT